MSTPRGALTAAGITRAGPLKLLLAGREAFRQVPGLKWLLVQGFLLLYGTFVALGALIMGVVYRFVVLPLSANIGAPESGGGFFADLFVPVVAGLIWLGQVLLLAATLLFALVLSLSLMSLWFEALAGRIAAHRAGHAPGAPFSLRAWLGSLAHALGDGALLLVLALLALVLGLVPLAGPFLVFALASFLMGWEVREPYLAVRAAQGEPLRSLRRGLTGWTFRVGTLPVLLALVPWLGWLLLPVVLTYQVAGVAWLSEPKRQE